MRLIIASINISTQPPHSPLEEDRHKEEDVSFSVDAPINEEEDVSFSVDAPTVQASAPNNDVNINGFDDSSAYMYSCNEDKNGDDSRPPTPRMPHQIYPNNYS